jgi:hypothetical protein
MKVRGFMRLALFGIVLLGLTGLSFGQFGVSISIGVAPPPLPVYDQPPIPESGYIWTPGYWAWSDDGYYWVPGTWVQPPQEGLLWTPGYWGYDEDGNYAWNDGYWGNEVGYYGGVDYGYGYQGDGYAGGYWQGNNFYYNNAVNNIGGVRIPNVYTKQVIENRSENRVSFNGGQGGTQARPTAQQTQARSAHHVEATSAQKQQVQVAKSNPQMFAKNNSGKPAVAATSKPGDMSHAVAAKAAGGKVDPKVMQANSQNTPKANAKGGSKPAGNEAGRPTTPAAPASANERNVPKPASNEAARPTTPSTANERNVPKPSNAGPENNPSRARGTEPSPARPETGRPENGRPEAGPANGMPQSEGARRPPEPANRNAAPPARENEKPGNNAAPKERPEAPQKNNEKPKPDKNDKPE